jgi:hypothetical protein
MSDQGPTLADPVLETATSGGTPFELRALADDESVTIEIRWPSRGSEWQPLRIADLEPLLVPATGVVPWLESRGVLWGAWIGRAPDEVARFTHAPVPPPHPRTAKK